MRKKQRQEKQLKEQLKIENHRGNTFVGIRPTVFASRKHPSRARRKEQFRKEFF